MQAAAPSEPEHLCCPISGTLFENPILLPCCGQTVSRSAIVAWFASRPNEPKRCVMCRKDIPNFDPSTAVIVRNIAHEVDEYKRSARARSAPAPAQPPPPAQPQPPGEHQWSAIMTPVIDLQGNTLPVSEVKLSLDNASFTPKPSLFVAVVDRSGSMSGSPWRQVQDGLLHMLALSRGNLFVRMEIIAYESNAEIIDAGRTAADNVRVIRGMNAGGGTNFKAAFQKVAEVLAKYICVPEISPENASRNVSNVTIAFLTDGQADGSAADRIQLAETFRVLLAEKWPHGPLSVHAIGFGRDCDKVFLEAMWKTGAQEGTFRYAEPDENGDMLSRKLTSLFDLSTKNSTVTLTLQLSGLGAPFDPRTPSPVAINPLASSDQPVTIEVQFPLGENRSGSYRFWVHQRPDCANAQILLNSLVDRDVKIAVVDGRTLPTFKLLQKSIFCRWLSSLTDALASELLDLSNTKEKKTKSFLLHAALLEQKIVTLSKTVPAGEETRGTLERLEILEREAGALRSGAAINAGTVGDLRFGAQYLVAGPRNAPPANALPPPAVVPAPAIEQKAEFDEPVVRFNRGRKEDLKRNALQQSLVSTLCDWKPAAKPLNEALLSATSEQLLHKDTDGNTLLHLAAYCGHRALIVSILSAAKKVLTEENALKNYVNKCNETNETALTLAIKARGFSTCCETLLGAGALVPADRSGSLTRFCIDHGYARTAAILDRGSTKEILYEPEDRLSVEFLSYNIHRAIQTGSAACEKVNWSKYLTVALNKSSLELSKLILDHAPKSLLRLDTVAHFWPLCVLDDTDAIKVQLAELLVAYLAALWKPNENVKLRQFVNESDPISGDSLLFHAADRGSPHLLAMALKLGAEVDQTNKLGNTALWIACERRWPCIVDTLLLHGADPNRRNLKGNSPLVTICQKGNRALAERLLAHGADVNKFNVNGDTPLLICCRNGQHEVLKLLLDRADVEIVNHVAAIDGFNAVLAATEADKPDCLRVLKEYGMDLEHRTANDNAIIAGATSMHLAAYYGREAVLRVLLELGANPNATDIHGQTPLHTAVICGKPGIVKLLRGRSNIHIRDKSGNTAATYCRTEELRQLLVNPLLEPLISLARGGFGPEQTAVACQILKRTSQIGCLQPAELFNVITAEGRTPLIESVIYSNMTVAEVFLSLDPSLNHITKADWCGIDAWNWAHITGHARLKSKLASFGQLPPATAHQKIQECIKKHPSDAQILFLGTSPPASSSATPLPQEKPSDLGSRMSAILSSSPISQWKYQKGSSAGGEDDSSEKQIVSVVLPNDSQKKALAAVPLSAFHWEAKVFTVSKIVEGKLSLSPRQIAALYVYDTLGPSLEQHQGNLIETNSYAQLIRDALLSLAPFEGEVYLGVPKLDRSQFLPGKEIGRENGFVSASSVWCAATEHVKEFTAASKRQGVVFIVHSRTGRSISAFSRHAYDMEVIFLPATRFRVLQWYRGDVICLGQANIRQHTFGIKDPADYVHNQQALIIELQEI